MTDEKEMIEILQKRLQYFFDKQIPIHVTLKENKFLNGYVKEVSADFFILDDFKEGEQPVFYIEILPNGINAYKKEEKKDGN